MVRAGFAHLLMLLMVGVLGVNCSGQDQEETEFPSLLTALGSKLALADDYYDDDASEKDEPARPCCFPVVWQARAYNLLAVSSRGRPGRGWSVPTLSISADLFYVDGSRQRLAGHMDEQHGSRSVSFSWIFAVGSNRTGDLYVFDKDSKQCRHRTLRGVVWRRQCISSNATLRAGYSLGPDGRLNVQTWSFGGHSRQAPAIDGDDRRSPRPRVSFSAFVTVVPNTCVPVLVDCQGYVSRGVDQQQQELSRQMNIHDTNSLNDDESDYESYARRRVLPTDEAPDRRGSHHHSGGFAFIEHSIFSDVKTSITDPTVFTVPSYCKKSDPNTMHFDDSINELPTILERFIVL